jgi:thioredoxin 1
MSTTVDVDQKSFEKAVERQGIVVVDFWADWCMPCRMFAPTFEKVAAANPDVMFAKVDTEAHPALSAALRITSIPTLMVFRDGYLLYAQPGALPEKGLKTLVAKVRGLDMEKLKKEATTAPGVASHA